jgi:hypothetical protein
MVIDYRDLLKRYIHHVGGSEGIRRSNADRAASCPRRHA